MEPVMMSAGMQLFTYAIIFVAGITIGAAAVGSFWLYRRYNEMLENMKNIKVEIGE